MWSWRGNEDVQLAVESLSRVRRATVNEPLDHVAHLQNLSFTRPWSAESIAWELRETDVARLYLLEASAGYLIAYCACWVIFDELHINSLAVSPEARRRGHARQLLQAVFADVVAVGVTAATLEMRRSNEAARALYESLGFRGEAVRRHYYQQPWEDALIFWHRTLADASG